MSDGLNSPPLIASYLPSEKEAAACCNVCEGPTKKLLLLYCDDDTKKLLIFLVLFISAKPIDIANNGEETPGILLRTIGELLVRRELEDKGLLAHISLHQILLLHSFLKTEDTEEVNENLLYRDNEVIICANVKTYQCC